jgi:hypothetical protein
VQVQRDDQALRDAKRQKTMDVLQAAVSAIGITSDAPAATNKGANSIVPKTREDLTDGALFKQFESFELHRCHSLLEYAGQSHPQRLRLRQQKRGRV